MVLKVGLAMPNEFTCVKVGLAVARFTCVEVGLTIANEFTCVKVGLTMSRYTCVKVELAVTRFTHPLW